ncbi:hypothetical protein [uncultured Allofournierella sp.]|uniref:hypothetical protein n=1 Tax=uncultured Allofournierella sp. TaxID=1940258 RepID=UPI0025F1F86B|nr:hypothetical protein [uncultured Fournierella sp.]
MSISRLEQETIINFNEAEPMATIYTHNGALKRKLAKLAKERPADVRHSRSFPEGAEEYVVPKRWVRVNASRILSEAQREAALKNVNAARMAKLG